MNLPTSPLAHYSLAPSQRSPFILLTVFIALIGVMSLTGCVGANGAGKTSESTSGASSGTLAASATNVAFGSVKIGGKSVQSLTLTNTSATPVMINQANITGSGFSVVGGLSAISIPAGQQQAVQVQFAPVATGSATGTMAVTSNASDGAVAISLSGNGLSSATITAQPANQSVVTGQSAAFSVAATGTGTVTYQWEKNGALIGGATAVSYNTPAEIPPDNGAQFSVIVTDSTGSVVSNPAVLTVTTAPVAPSITAQPVSQSVNAGQSATFNVTATGTATLAYQWRKNGAVVNGALASSYTTPATAASDNGASFTVTVTNQTGSMTSSAAMLTVGAPPVITAQPSSQTVNVGQTSTFSVAATGTGTLNYQWNKNGTAISGATSTSYTAPAAASSDNGSQFSVTVTNGAGSVNSSAATLTVSGPPTIVSQPTNQSVTVGHTASFNVTATATGTLTYQWKKNGTAIGGASSSAYTTPVTAAGDTGTLFSVTVTGSTGSVTSNTASLTVTATPVAPSITSQPTNQTVNAGQTATFSVTASGTATLTYQWTKNGSAIGGATGASYTTPATSASDNGASFAVTITNSTGNVTSNAATLTVNVATAITAQPANKSVTTGQTATFSVTASGTGTLAYQWNKNGTAISGATSASYTTAATTSADNGTLYSVTVTGTSGSVISNAATLTVTAAAVAPSISTQPANQTVNAGQTATFNVVATGTATLTYQWSKNGTAIGGATSTSYTTPAAATSDNGAQFTVAVTNATGNATSSAATLTVNAATLLLNVSQTSLNFSSVTLGSNSVLPVTFTNTGNSSVTISNVSISGAGFTASGISSGQMVAPGKTATLNVTFAPASAGNVTGASAIVTSNAANSPATISLTGTGVQTVSHSVTLTWSGSSSAVSGYNLYRSSVTGGPYTKLNSALVSATSYTDSTVQSGQTYYYVVTSVDSSGDESADSTEVSATIP